MVSSSVRSGRVSVSVEGASVAASSGSLAKGTLLAVQGSLWWASPSASQMSSAGVIGRTDRVMAALRGALAI